MRLRYAARYVIVECSALQASTKTASSFGLGGPVCAVVGHCARLRSGSDDRRGGYLSWVCGPRLAGPLVPVSQQSRAEYVVDASFYLGVRAVSPYSPDAGIDWRGHLYWRRLLSLQACDA